MKRHLISSAVLALFGIAALTSHAALAENLAANSNLSASESRLATKSAANESTSAKSVKSGKSAKSLVTTQLPRTVKPSHYDLSITPNAKESRFSAKVAITLDVVENTSSITLHAADLTFSKASLLGTNKASASLQNSVPTISVNAEEQTATFTFKQPLAKGNYQLYLEYDGIIGTQAVGLFSLDYDTPQGKKRALYTQFENSDARRVVPSWDEPNYKATFALTLTVPSDEMAVSNMPIAKKTDIADGLSIVQFAPTPKMSTYLLFMGLGDFERATEMVDGTEVGVIAKRGNIDQAQFVLTSTKAILREFNDYFDTPYPIPKIDNVAAPGQSQFFSAMENWGAIFTFERSILLDPSISTQADKRNAFATTAHEMAHQWFGNLVTMQWWDDLWLNEGFASWMESRTTARLHPEWQTEMDAVGTREQAMARDSIVTSHPVVQHIATVEQASQAFDSITYQKGESVIRMLENYVGYDAWRAGVRAYMRKHAYGNTVSKDFWTQIEKAAGKPILAIAHDFTQQAGVPMIQVNSMVCKQGKTTIQLSQGEFSRDMPHKKSLLWRVPVVAKLVGTEPEQKPEQQQKQEPEQKQEARTLVINGKGSLVLKGCGTVVVNAGQTGYYRTLYAPKVFTQIAKDFSSIATIDQVGILSDSWAMGLAGQQAIADVLELTVSVPENASHHVWSEVAGIFSSVNYFYKEDPQRQQKLRELAIARLSPKMVELGWIAKEGEPDYVADFRSTLISVLSDVGDPKTINEARRRYAAMDKDASAAPAAIRHLVMSIVAHNADAATWDGLRARAQAEQSSLIKSSLYRLLASSKDANLAQRALDLALTEEPGLTTSASMLAQVASEHPDLAYDFAIAHIDQVNQRVDATSRSRYFPQLGGGSTDAAMIDKLNTYAKAHLDESSRRDVDTAIVNIQSRIQTRKERKPAIDAWIDQH